MPVACCTTLPSRPAQIVATFFEPFGNSLNGVGVGNGYFSAWAGLVVACLFGGEIFRLHPLKPPPAPQPVVNEVPVASVVNEAAPPLYSQE